MRPTFFVPFITLALASTEIQYATPQDLSRAITTGRNFVAFVTPPDSASALFLREWRTTLHHNHYHPFTIPSTESPKAEGESLKVEGETPISLLTVNCHADPHLCSPHDIPTTPIVRLYDNGRLHRYRNPKEAPAMLQYLSHLSQPPIMAIPPSQTAEFLFSFEYPVLFSVPNDEETKDLYHQIVADIAERWRGVATVAVMKTEDLPTVKCRDSRVARQFTGPVDANIASLVTHCLTTSGIRRFTHAAELDAMSSPTSLLLFHSPSSLARTTFTTTFASLAARYSEYLTFFTVNSLRYPELLPLRFRKEGVTPSFLQETSEYDYRLIDHEGQPTTAKTTGLLTLVNQHVGATFVAPVTEITAEIIGEFISDVLSGSILSEEVLELQSQSQILSSYSSSAHPAKDEL